MPASVTRLLTGFVLTAISFAPEMPLRSRQDIISKRLVLLFGVLTFGWWTRQLRKAQRRSDARAQAILDHAPDGLLLLRADGVIEDANPAFLRLSGYQRHEVEGQLPLDGLVVSDNAAAWEALQAAGRGQTRSLEVVSRRADGSTFDASLTLAPLGEGPGAVACVRDISMQKQAERLKDAYVTNITCELRAPIVSLRVYHALTTLKPENTPRYMESIRRTIDRMGAVVEDAVRLSRIETGSVAPDLADVDLSAFIGERIRDQTALADQKGVSLSFSQDGAVPPVRADPDMLGQTLAILLTNALNYTPSGGRVEVRTTVRENGGRRWTGFSVKDSGPGIAPEDQPRLFERFFRGSAGRESGESGTGLGLSIAREIVERHQGRIEVSSVPGEGAEFTVWLPASG